MFPAAYFAPRYFAPRYWPKLGAAPALFNPAWAAGSNAMLGAGGPP
jgi:hypothetical protein